MYITQLQEKNLNCEIKIIIFFYLVVETSFQTFLNKAAFINYMLL